LTQKPIFQTITQKKPTIDSINTLRAIFKKHGADINGNRLVCKGEMSKAQYENKDFAPHKISSRDY